MADNIIFESSDSVGRGRLTGKYKLSWIEESFDLEAPAHPDLAVSHTRSYLGKSISESRTGFFLKFLLIGIILVFARLVYLQIIRGDHYRALAEGNRIRIIPIVAERGIIYDRENRELVQNIPSFVLSILPQDLPRAPGERQRIIERVAALAEVSVEDITKTLEKYTTASFQSLVVRENLNYEAALKLYTENADLPGIVIEGSTKRGYFQDRSATSTPSLSHVLGYLGKLNETELNQFRSSGYLLSDSIGKTGIEKTYEPYLRGVYGRKRVEVDALGREQSLLAIDPPKSGSNLILSLDLDAQRTLERSMREHLSKLNKQRASAVALDPTTGAVLAFVSWPAFDNNLFSGGIASTTYRNYLEDPDRPLFNRLIGGTYPPGSTVKLISSLAGLEERIITPATTVMSVGGINVGGHLFKDWKAGGHGLTNVTKAIAWSVNTFFHYVGGGYGNFAGLGSEKLRTYFANFGMGQETGIDLPGEQAGFLPSREWKLLKKGEQWYVGDTYNLVIGQGDLLVTPLQVALWTSAVANGGKLVRPYLAEKYVDSTGQEQPITRPETKKAKADEGHLRIVRQGMSECVAYGSCKLLQNLPFSSGGKTGTAQWKQGKPTHAWFTSFAPADKPKIVVTVMVEEGGEGATAAMPIAEEFLRWWGKKYLTQS